MKNDKLLFWDMKNFGFDYINFYRLKKDQLLNKFSRISTRPKKGQIFFCLEKAKPGNPEYVDHRLRIVELLHHHRVRICVAELTCLYDLDAAATLYLS